MEHPLLLRVDADVLDETIRSRPRGMKISAFKVNPHDIPRTWKGLCVQVVKLAKRHLPMLLCLCALLPVPCGNTAEVPELARSDGISVYGDPVLANLAAQIVQMYPRVKGDLEEIFGWEFRSRPDVLLIADRETFERMSGSRHFSAFAVPKARLVAINLPSVRTGTYLLYETFKHELCHLLLHDRIGEDRLPKWLDEGVCQWVSGSLGELLIAGGTGATAADVASNPIPLARLDRDFPDDQRSLMVAYETSRSFVEYISGRFGREGLLAVLNRLAAGDHPDRAFSAALSVPLAALEEDWRAGLRGGDIWLAWLGRYFYEVLFFIMALLAVAGGIRLAIRRRRYGEDEEEDDGLSGQDR